MTSIPTGVRALALVLLRTLIGWHFLYEGYYKLALPGWSRAGQPLAAWTAAGYLKASSGPLAGLFRPLATSSFAHWIDVFIPVALVLIGVSLLLGLFTQVGSWGAAALLATFYLSAVPTTGLPQAGTEGAYLLVSKTLIELVAVLVLLSFHTGRIAGLDLLLPSLRTKRAPARGDAGPALQAAGSTPAA